MTSAFIKKALTPPQRVCFRLRALRQENNIGLEEMEKKTMISKQYLQALEECRFRDIPYSAVYQKNFVKKYVEALGLESEPFIKQYLIEESVKEKKQKTNKDIARSRWCFLPTVLRFGGLFLLALIFISYLGWQVKRIIEPPRLVVYSPVEGMIVTEQNIFVQGETEKEAVILVNGREIKNGESGQFKEEISLSAGVNTLEIVVKKKHGKTTMETRHVVYKESAKLSR